MEAAPCNDGGTSKDRCTMHDMDGLLPRRNKRCFAATHSTDVVNFPVRVYVFTTNRDIDRFKRLARIDQSDG